MESLSSAVIRGEEDAIKRASELVSQVTEENIEHLPSMIACQRSSYPILVADILMTRERITVSAFGFRRAGDKLALHDHPNIFGFIKCVRGSMKVRSFTPLSNISQNELNCRYEGEKQVNIASDVLHLSPTLGNIHEIEALEDGTFFFDALYPGYHNDNDCTYYEENTRVIERGATTILKKLAGPPSWQAMIGWNFPSL